MIIPDNKIPVDDSDNSDAEDQQSQQDVHSNGLDEQFDSSAEESARLSTCFSRHQMRQRPLLPWMWIRV